MSTSATGHPSAYFVPAGPDVYTPTVHTGGAWSDEDLHVSPVAGLLVHHMERWRRDHGEQDEKTVARITFDILGRLVRDDITLTTRVLRPGRTIELLETTASMGGRDVLTARTWLMSDQDTAGVADGEWEPLPHPDGLPEHILTDTWPGGYIDSITMRAAGTSRPGRGRAWMNTDLALVDGEAVSSLASYVALIDTANGIAVRQHPEEWMFPNLDLTIHLFRAPEGSWVGLDTTVAFGPTGQGLTSSVLHDVRGPVGTAQQILTVRRNG